MGLFRKIAEEDIDSRQITLAIMRRDDGVVVGRISGLAIGDNGLQMISTFPDDPPVTEAIHTARLMAESRRVGVDVIDVDGLWEEAWGPLGSSAI
jgi:hypothetical protein